MIFNVQVPAGSSPQVCTDIKSQFLKPLDDVSLSLSARSTVVVPEATPKGANCLQLHLGLLFATHPCVHVCTSLTCGGGKGDVQVSSPGVFNAGLHLHMLQGADGVLLALAGFGWNLYGDLSRRLQLPAERIELAAAATSTNPRTSHGPWLRTFLLLKDNY